MKKLLILPLALMSVSSFANLDSYREAKSKVCSNITTAVANEVFKLQTAASTISDKEYSRNEFEISDEIRTTTKGIMTFHQEQMALCNSLLESK